MDVSKLDTAMPQKTLFVSEGLIREDKYFSARRISNSSFDYIPYLLKGKQRPALPQEAINFGSALHCAILEPEKFRIADFAGVNEMLLHRLVEACNNSKTLQAYLKYSLKEVSHNFEMLELPCKAKIDMIYVGIEAVLDLKTTNAKTQEDFIATISKYNYDRQMAFYIDSIQAKRAILIGISKQTFELFFCELSDSQINKGYEKYTQALQTIKEFNLEEKIYESSQRN